MTCYDAWGGILRKLRRWVQARDHDDDGTFRYPPVRQTPYWRPIRLLRLDPGDPSAPLAGDLISCAFVTIWLWSFQFDVPAYDALSYCWGGESPPASILLSGAPLCITPNLAAALTRLRHPDRPRYLWADQICIDQRSVNDKGVQAEKAFQVRRMGEIYANARTVVVWLGAHSDASRVLFAALADVDDASAQNRGMYFMDEMQPGAKIQVSVLAALRMALKSPALPAWAREMPAATATLGQRATTRELLLRCFDIADAASNATTPELVERRRILELERDTLAQREMEQTIFVRLFEDVLEHAWFERAWTFQEAALAGDLQLHAGDSPAVPWRRFAGALRIVQQETPQENLGMPSKNRQALEVIELLRSSWYSLDGPKHSLREILEACRPRQAMNPRDKVYGLLGLYSSWSVPRMPESNEPAIDEGSAEVVAFSEYYAEHRADKGPQVPPVDYQKTEERVFLDVATSCMAAGSLRILKDCCTLAAVPPLGTKIMSPFHGQYLTKSAGLQRPLPSWVPDWSADANTDCKSPVVDDVRYVDQRYRAAKDTKAKPRALFQAPSSAASDPCATALLAVTGLLLSPVVEVSTKVHTYSTLNSPSAQAIWAEWQRIALHDADASPYLVDAGPSDAGPLDALWRTLILDVPSALSGGRAAPDIGKGFDDALAYAIVGGALPPGFEARRTKQGRIYYVDHNAGQTSWMHPRGPAGGDAAGSLPEGWEASMTKDGRTYYVDHGTETTTWERPDGSAVPQPADRGERGMKPISKVEFAMKAKPLREWLGKYGNRHIKKRLFRMEDGYLGMSCTHVRVDDRVAVLWVGRLPFLLRSCGTVRLLDGGSGYEPIKLGDTASD